MPSSTDPQNAVWLKKHLNVWKAKSSEADAMRLKAYEKIITKSMNKAKYRHPNKCKSEVNFFIISVGLFNHVELLSWKVMRKELHVIMT